MAPSYLPHPSTYPSPPTASWRTPTHLRTLASQIATAPPSPLPTLLHLTLHSILPFLFFTTFVIAGTIVLAYTLSLGKPVPTRFVIGATVAFAVLVLAGMVLFVWVRVKFRGRGLGDGDEDVEAKLTGGGRARFVRERDAAEDRLTGGGRAWYAPGRTGWKGEYAAVRDPIPRPPAAHIPIPELGLHSVPHAEEEPPRCVSSIEPIPWVENAHPIPADGLPHTHPQPVRASLRHSHELHASASPLHPQPPRRNPGRADTPRWTHGPREPTPQLDRYPRPSTPPPSPSSTRADVPAAHMPQSRASRMRQPSQDPARKISASATTGGGSGYRGVAQAGWTGAGAAAPLEPVLMPRLPNRLRKARGMGKARRRSWGSGRRSWGVRSGAGKEEVVLESVEKEWPAEGREGKEVRKGVGSWGGVDGQLAGLGLAEMEGMVQRALLVYHEEGRGV